MCELRNEFSLLLYTQTPSTQNSKKRKKKGKYFHEHIAEQNPSRLRRMMQFRVINEDGRRRGIWSQNGQNRRREKRWAARKRNVVNSRNSRNTRPWMRSTIEFSVGSLEKENGVGRRGETDIVYSRVDFNLSRAPGNESSCLACARGLRKQRFPDLCTTENTTRLS